MWIFSSTLEVPVAFVTKVIKNCSLTSWLTTATSKDLKTFANEPIPVIVMIQAPVEVNGWRIEDAEFVVVRDGLKCLIGGNEIDALSISFLRTLNSIECHMLNNISTERPFKTRIANQFQQLISRIVRSKVHIVKSKFHKNFQPKHQKDSSVFINLKDKLKNEI